MSTSPGWYPDPAAPETQRYWDGEQWVGEPIPADAAPPASPPVVQPPPPPDPIPRPAETPVLASGVLPVLQVPDGFAAASLERRLGARALDALAVLLLCGLANAWLGYRYVQIFLPYFKEALENPNSQPTPDSRLSSLFYGMLVISLLVWFAYEVIATNHSGQTLGKRLLRIKVIAMDGAPVDFRSSLRRWMIMALPFVFPCCLPLSLIDVLWCTWDRPLSQCVHDKSARTIVVSARPVSPRPVSARAGKESR